MSKNLKDLILLLKIHLKTLENIPCFFKYFIKPGIKGGLNTASLCLVQNMESVNTLLLDDQRVFTP